MQQPRRMNLAQNFEGGLIGNANGLTGMVRPGTQNPGLFNPRTGQIYPKQFFNNLPQEFNGMESEAAVKNREAAYNYITKDYGTNKAQEMEAAKQELANKGIPIDPSPESLYGRTLKELDNKYKILDDQAKNQSYGMGLDALSTQAGISSNQFQNFLRAVLGGAAQNSNVYGIDQGNATIIGGPAPGFS